MRLFPAGFGLGVVMVVVVVVTLAVVAIVTNTHASSHNFFGFSESLSQEGYDWILKTAA